ncbi:MAG: DUF5686 and carboxypeptidase regulatory-like domain-containing protein [Chloroherpetonaceae bacterium]|nr:DUF5686 and carboxypeptidase regulatory-like domain-containing protein [Chloroherpetonaceae bacterium]
MMRRGLFPILLVLLTYTALWAQSEPALYGKITDKKTGEPLAGATIRVKDASGNILRGAKANAEGRYRIVLPMGRYTVEVRYLGYQTRIEQVAVALPIEKNFELVEGEVRTAEIVVDAGEDLVTTIMKRAIREKKRQRDSLRTYELEAYTKRLTRRDTSIAGITETFAKGYWRKGDTLREIVIQERITENIKAQIPSGAVIAAGIRNIIDFSEERIPIVGNRFVSPLANDAFSCYGFELLETTHSEIGDIFTIKLIPKNSFIPLFSGTIKIAANTYALVAADLVPNRSGFKLPYVKDIKLAYKQTQELYHDAQGNAFWLPATQFLEGGLTVSVAGGFVELPRISFTQTTMIYRYTVNEPVPDTVFEKRLVTKSASAEKFDSAFWKERAFVALTKEEEVAYQTLDSSKTLLSQFQPRGMGARLGVGAQAPQGFWGHLLNFPNIRFNRVEGFFLGGKLSLDSLTALTAFNGSLGYGTERKEWLWTVGVEQWFDKERKFSLGLEAYRTTTFTPERNGMIPIANALLGLFERRDYHNYFQAEGFKALVRYRPNLRFSYTLSFLSEQQRTMPVVPPGHRWFSWLESVSFRDNPPIQDGMMRSLTLEFNYGTPFATFLGQPTFFVQVEHASATLGSEFDFTRLWATGSLRLRSFFSERFLSPYFAFYLELGTFFGSSLPMQRYFSVESPIGGLAFSNVLVGVSEKELIGTSLASLIIEHNFQAVPFELLGIDFLADENIQLILRAGGASIWQGTASKLYGEVGVGIGGILGLIRLDGTVGFLQSHSPRFRWAIGLGLLL